MFGVTYVTSHMQIHVSPRHLTLTAAIHGYVADKVEHLESIAEEIIGAHCVLIHDEGGAVQKKYQVKVHLAIPGPDVHAESYDSDLYAAIDKVVDKLARQLRKRKTRVKLRNRHVAQVKVERKKRFG